MKDRGRGGVFTHEMPGAEGAEYRGTVRRAMAALMTLDSGCCGSALVSPYLVERLVRKPAKDAVRPPKPRARGVVSVRPFTVKARPETRVPHLRGDRAYKVLAMTKDELMVADDRNRIVWVDRGDVLYANGESA